MDARADKVIPSRSVLMRFLVRSWEYRRPRLWVGVRVACGIFNVVLGVLLLASVQRLGPLAWLAALPLAGAVLIFWTVYRLQQDSVLRVRELEQSRAMRWTTRLRGCARSSVTCTTARRRRWSPSP